jgi:mono/diheme cytochrome c family protein
MLRAATICVVSAALAIAQDAGLPERPGKKLVLQVCTRCHAAETFAGLRLSREEWKHEVNGMIARGAKANRAQARRIVDYLAANLGKYGRIAPTGNSDVHSR